MELAAFSDRGIGTRERLEDYAADRIITTPGGLQLQIAMVCDGAGGGEAGELAARLTSRTIFEYLEISPETSVPKLLIKAVEEANKSVYSELQGTGTSTVALAAVHLNDGATYGRLYIANVGNSRIYLIREGRLVRLNIDHTLANEYVFAGQMSPEEAKELNDPHYVTRSIGTGAKVSVDIGFYAERGRDFVNSRRASRIGQKGMELLEGDTIFAASDGLFPFVQDSEFVEYALDDDVERATRTLLKYAADRRPDDNTALSMLFVPSRNRKMVQTTQRLSNRQRAGIGFFIVAIVLALAFMGLQVANGESQRVALLATQTFVQQIVIEASYTHTPTPLPATATATLAVVAGQVGSRFSISQPDGIAIFAGRFIDPLSPPEINYVSVAGANVLAASQLNNPANLYFQPLTSVRLTNVIDDPGKQQLDLGLGRGADMFVNLGDYRNGGVSVALEQNPDITFQSQSTCFASKQISADPSKPQDTDKVALTCFGGDNTCSYQLPGEDPVLMSASTRFLLDVNNNTLIDTGSVSQEEIDVYRETIWTLTHNPDQLNCLQPWLDEDKDGINFPNDECPFEAGSIPAHGCPDEDNDGVQDSVDQCLGDPGPASNKGCPIPDVDNDGLAGNDDFCPFDAGPAETGGCPDANQYFDYLTQTAVAQPTITGTPTITPTPTETPIPLPEANDDTYSTEGGKTLSILAPGVLLNDVVSDALLTAYTGSTTKGGTVVLSTSGAFTYIPPLNFVGLDTFSYTLTNTLGSASATVTINVLKPPIDPPVAAFTANPTVGAAPLFVSFTDASTGSINSYSWDFGDGSTSVAANPSHTYTAPGVYSVTLTVTGPGGTDTATGTITVTASTPTATPSLTATIGVPTATFTLTPSDTPIVPQPTPLPPIACYRINNGTASITTNAGVLLNFDAGCSQNGASYAWNFGDGGTATGVTPKYAYTNPGVYTVTLTVTGFAGTTPLTSTATGTVTVGPRACFTPKTISIAPNGSVTFDGTCSSAGVTYSWDFGDGSPVDTVSGVSATHTYGPALGNFTVTLTVTDANGTGTTTGTVTVEQPPTACFTPATNITITQGQTQNFDASCSQPGGLTYTWTITPAAGVAVIQNGALAAMTFNPAGPLPTVIQVCLTVRTTVDSTNNPCINVTVQAAAVCSIPVANPDNYLAGSGNGAGTQITIPAPGVLANDSVTLPGTALAGPAGNVSFYGGTVALGGGANLGRLIYTPPPLTGAATFPVPPAAPFTDTFTYTLTGPGVDAALNPCVSTGTVSILVNDRNAALTAAFTFTPPAGGNAPLTVNFDASTSTGPIVSFTWDFGDGTTTVNTTSPTTSHVYTIPGNYNVTLTVNGVTPPGNTAQTNQVVPVTFPLPVACMTVTPPSPPNPLTTTLLTFSSACSQNGVDFFWDFGDGTTSILPNPTHTYAFPGFYFVFLIVSNPAGSSFTSTFIIVDPPPPPTACMTVNGAPPDPPPVLTTDVLTFDAACSTNAVTYSWDFGDGSPAVNGVTTTTHTYATPGVYFASLIVGNTSGSSIVFAQIIVSTPPPIRIPPNAAISAVIVDGSTVSFDSTSTGNINIYDWNLGDGTAHISDSSFTHTFPAVGIYDVSLIVVGPLGADVATVTIDLNATPTPTNTWVPRTLTPTPTLEPSQQPPQDNNTPQPPQPTPKPTRKPTKPPPPTDVPPPTDIPVPPPIAVDDSFSVGAGGSISVHISQVLGNDTLNGASASSIGGTSHGSIVQSGDDPNVYIYTPDAGFTGTDTAHYSLTNAGGSSSATVTFNVNG